jgi:hypothetical protein
MFVANEHGGGLVGDPQNCGAEWAQRYSGVREGPPHHHWYWDALLELTRCGSSNNNTSK